jgi:hypothetical protein
MGCPTRRAADLPSCGSWASVLTIGDRVGGKRLTPGSFDNAASSGLLSDFGYDADKLAAERGKIEAYDAANQAQEAAKGSAQQATQDQEAALAAMNDWVAQYLKIAKVALRSKKQSLEKIGVTARTTKTAAQRAAPKKAAATRAAKKTA